MGYEIANYQDSRLVPPDIAEDRAPTALQCWLECEHGNACLMQVVRLSGIGRDAPMDSLVKAMGCDECCDERTPYA